MDIFLGNQFICNVFKEQLLQELSDHSSLTQWYKWYTRMRCFYSKWVFSPWVGAAGPTFDSLTCPVDCCCASMKASSWRSGTCQSEENCWQSPSDFLGSRWPQLESMWRWIFDRTPALSLPVADGNQWQIRSNTFKCLSRLIWYCTELEIKWDSFAVWL